LNQKHNANIRKLPISNLDLSTDAWLTGFIDADGNFATNIKNRKNKKKKNRMHRLNVWFILKQVNLTSLFVNLLPQTYVSSLAQPHINVVRKQYNIEITSAKSKTILRAYLDKFPLLSSKYLDYKDWCTVDDLIISNMQFIQEETVRQIKSKMISRTKFNWEHLNEF
jgi:hypothetical protein